MTPNGSINQKTKDNYKGQEGGKAQAQNKFDDDILREKQPYGSIKDDDWKGFGDKNDMYEVSVQAPDFGRDSTVRPSSASMPSEARVLF